MIVVADTSPLNYLIQIDCDSLLPELYGRILVPQAVIEEMDMLTRRRQFRLGCRDLRRG